MAELKDSLCDYLHFSKQNSHVTVSEKIKLHGTGMVRVRLFLVPGRERRFPKNVLSRREVLDIEDWLLGEGMGSVRVQTVWSGVEVTFTHWL